MLISNVRLDVLQMQDVSESAQSLDDDMVDGDLGNGMEVRAPTISIRKKSQTFAGLAESHLLGAERLRHSSQTLDAVWLPGLKIAETQRKASWKPTCSGNVCHLTIELKHNTYSLILQRKPCFSFD